jgi:hypothetical protein
MNHTQNIETDSQYIAKQEIQTIDKLLIQGPLEQYQWEINLAEQRTKHCSIETLRESAFDLIKYFGFNSDSINYQILFKENGNNSLTDRRKEIIKIYLNLYRKLLDHKSRIEVQK